MYFCEYCDKNKVSLLGSDSVFILDGRKTRPHQITDCTTNMQRKRSVMHPYPTYFRIFTGSILNPIYISDYIYME